MYDMHYDLLTILYEIKNKKKNYYLQKSSFDFFKRYTKNNIVGGIVNLYFMSPYEMNDKLGIEIKELFYIPKMFSESISYLKYLQIKFPSLKNIDFIYSIEGADYIKNLLELEILYNMGLRSILIVWNHKNRYASGILGDGGLTKEGKIFLKKAISLGIMIDVSHANEETFYDILNIIECEKSKGKKVFLIASHSNVYSVYNHIRNLKDKQILRLKELDGYLGLVTYMKFLTDRKELLYGDREILFMKHLEYIIDILNFPINRIVISTDDMRFYNYQNQEVYPIINMKEKIYINIKDRYGEDIANQIIKENARQLLSKLKKV